MSSKIIREKIATSPQRFEIVERALDFLEENNNTQDITKEDYFSQLKLAENAIKNETNSCFIAALLLHKTFYRNPQIREKIKKLLGKENIKPLLALNIVQTFFENSENVIEKDYLSHSINTAQILSSMRMGDTTITAALLHHLSHVDPKIHIKTLPSIEKQLGSKICKIIQQYNKINHFTNKAQNFSHNVREILLVMAQDVRVIFIKMASMIDTLKKIDKVNSEEKYLIAKQAKEIMAPLADMLGVWRFRWKLEDYSFKILQPKEYDKIAMRFGQEGKKTRDKYISKVTKMLKRETENRNIQCEINGRFKHYYSIYRKMKTKQKTFNEIHDVFALRVIAKSEEDCYLLLHLIHQLWPPVHKRIKDYIAAPKENGYQTLHTTVVGPGNRLTEFQIRTEPMHQKALYGVAAQSFYKNQETDNDWSRKILRTGIFSTQKNVWEEELSKIFQEKIYVYTPKGDVVSLPKGSTPVDFAYQIHSEVGHFCKFAIVNNQPVELNRRLKNEDVVEIITDINSGGPDQTWQKFVKTPLAKKRIEKFLEKNLL